MRTKSGTNIEDVQEMNRALIIDLLRQRQIYSRAELAKVSGLKKATITNIINWMMDCELVRETGKLIGERGKRAVGVELNADRFKVLSVHLARRCFSVALVDFHGNVRDKVKHCIPADEPPRVTTERIRGVVCSYLERQDGYRILGVGMAAPGPVMFRKNRIAYRVAEFPGWEAISMEEEFKNKLDVPFFFEQDANAGTLAEWKYGSYTRQSGIMVYMLTGDGIGGGVVINGDIQHGSQGFFAEVGHTSINMNGEKCACGNRGCLELYASCNSLVKAVEDSLPSYPGSVLNQTRPVDLNAVIDALRQGDTLAEDKVREVSTSFGFGLVNIINSYDPDIIIIGDGLNDVGEPMLSTVREVVREHMLPEIYENVRIELSSLGADAVLLGVAALVLDRLMANPTTLFEPSVPQE